MQNNYFIDVFVKGILNKIADTEAMKIRDILGKVTHSSQSIFGNAIIRQSIGKSGVIYLDLLEEIINPLIIINSANQFDAKFRTRWDSHHTTLLGNRFVEEEHLNDHPVSSIFLLSLHFILNRLLIQHSLEI